MFKRIRPLIAFVLCLLLTTSVSGQITEHEIVNDQKQRGVKRSVDVRLLNRISEADLEVLGRSIHDADRSAYPQTFILYYLPEMEVGSGAWAATHFRPGLKVQIFGMTKEEHDQMNEAADSPVKGELIGVWLDERPYAGRRLTLVNRSEKYFLMALYPDGSEGEQEVVKTDISGGTRFGKSATSEDFYLLRSNGDLELRDSMGLIAKLKKVQ